MRSELHNVLFLALSVTFLFVHEISRETLHCFAPNSHRTRDWSLAQASLNVKAKVKVKVTTAKNGVFGGYLGSR